MDIKKSNIYKIINTNSVIIICLTLSITTLFVYWRVINCDFVNFDDTTFVTQNAHVQAGLTLDGIKFIFTNPSYLLSQISMLSHMLDCEFFGLNAGMHHLISLIIHIANVILLFILFYQTTGAFWRSAFVAALFALHPLNVESVAWIAERRNVLSTFFWFVTMIAYLKYIKNPDIFKYSIVLLSFILGLMSKSMLVTLPFTLLLFDFWPLERFHGFETGFHYHRKNKIITYNLTRQLVKLTFEKIPLLIITLFACILTLIQMHNPGEIKGIGGLISTDTIPLAIRFANAIVAYASYIVMLFNPTNLAVLYPHPGMPPLWKLASAGCLLLLTTYLSFKYARKHPYFIVGWLWYLGTLVPVIGLVQIGRQSLADRYTYVPFIGLFTIMAWGFHHFAKKSRFKKLLLNIIPIIFLLFFITITWHQIGFWKNSITLFERALKVTSNNYVAHLNLGLALCEQGRTDDAIKHIKEALAIKPDIAEGHNNLGMALYKKGRINQAIGHFRQALKLRESASPHYNLGLCHEIKRNTKEAIYHFEQALKLEPDFAEAHNNLGNALLKIKNTNQAIFHFKQALNFKPDFAEAHNNLGNALLKMKNTNQAIFHFKQALNFKPDFAEAHNNLGNILFKSGDTDAAIKHFIKAIQIKPDFAEAHNNLAIIFIHNNDFNQATYHLKEALRINPDYLTAKNNLNRLNLMQPQNYKN